MAIIERFRSRAERMRDARIEDALQLVLEFEADGLDSEAAGKVLAFGARKQGAPVDGQQTWKFVMLGIEEALALDAWLYSGGSKRPHLASRMLLHMEANLRRDTGEVLLSRQQLADRLGERVEHVSRVVGDLERGGALRRVRDGRRMRYFLTSRLATHLPDNEREAAQAAEGPIGAVQLTLIDGGVPAAGS